MRHGFVAAASVAVTMGAGAPPKPDIAPELLRVLTGQFAFTPADLADIQHEKVVRRTLAATAPGEVAVVGALRVHASKAAFVNRVKDIVNFKRGPEVLQIGTFGKPPSAADLAALSVGPDDFDPASCRVHDCDIRIPADAITRIQQAIAGSRGNEQVRGASEFKEVLAAHVRAYLDGGKGRITEYDDGDAPIRPSEQFADILAKSHVLALLAPGMPEHLRDPAAVPLANADDIVYWSKEKFGLAPFITVTHACITCPSAAMCVIAARDVYSSRYFDASLSLTIAADVAQTANTFDLVYANRSRANALKGAFGGLRRAIAERRARSGLEDTLKRLRQSLEHR
jgi:hypothetical protein